MLEPIPDLPLAADRAKFRAECLQLFSQFIYGASPTMPDIRIETRPLGTAQLVSLTLLGRDAEMTVDAAFWRPGFVSNPPAIVALDFLGPVGLGVPGFPIDPNARVYVPDPLGGGDRLHEKLRGALPNRVPIQTLLAYGYAVLVSCYGSWTPDCPDTWASHGAAQFTDEKTGAIALWAWAYRILSKVASELCAPSCIAAAGHSRLGKAALWAAANDDNIDAVFANQSGCFGAAPRAHAVGETPSQLINRFPHWTIADTGNPANLDQHQLLATIAPRKLYLGQSKDDLWADPAGSVAALEAAAPAWGRSIKSDYGHHLRDGGHDLLEEDWARFLKFLSLTTH